MELRHYYMILRRSWPLVIGLPLLVALISAAMALNTPPRYGARVAMLVTQQQIAATGPSGMLPDYNNYNSWATSEFIVDDMTQLVGTRRFAQDIQSWIKQQYNTDLDLGMIQGGLSAERKHRTVYLSAQARQPDHALWIAQGAVAVLQQNGLDYWGRADSAQLGVSVLDLPEQAGQLGGARTLLLDVAIRTILAIALAVGIAFLRYYLDQTLRRRSDVEALGLEVVGAIPFAKGAKG